MFFQKSFLVDNKQLNYKATIPHAEAVLLRSEPVFSGDGSNGRACRTGTSAFASQKC